MTDDLIFDVGMHCGNDAEFYLKKGFRVVGVEADPVLAERAAQRLSSYVDSGRLIVLNLAIQDYDGETEFFANRCHDDWGTLSASFVRRNESILASRHEPIRVACTRFGNVLLRFGVPYYLKIDIEGADSLCLQAMLSQEARPKFISIEADLTSFAGAFAQLALLWRLGYRRFKLINQAMNHVLRCPDPPREGVYVRQNFDGLCSGTFGEETPGPWREMDELLHLLKKILKLQSRFGVEGRYFGTPLHKLHRAWRRLTGREAVGWYDLHAKA